MNKKKRYKPLIAAVRSILINDWDPVGISTNPNLADEYDAYIGRILAMLYRHCSCSEIATFLRTIEYKEMGCKTNSITRHRVATRLQKCFQNSNSF